MPETPWNTRKKRGPFDRESSWNQQSKIFSTGKCNFEKRRVKPAKSNATVKNNTESPEEYLISLELPGIPGNYGKEV